jgi:hypothetical protein
MLISALSQLISEINARLTPPADETLHLVERAAGLIYLEQHPALGLPRAVTPAMDPHLLYVLLEGMSLALDLDRGLAPSPATFDRLLVLGLPILEDHHES